MANAQNTGKVTPSVNQMIDASIPASFGTVLDSVQGLQQRLGDFSADHISEAEKSTQTLIFHLTEIERKLCRLVKIQRLMSAAQKQAAGGESLDLPNMKELDNSLPPHAPEYSSNLIPFPRPHKALKGISKSFLFSPAPEIHQTDDAKPGAGSEAKQAPILHPALPDDPAAPREEFASFAAKEDLAGLEVSPIAVEDFPQPEVGQATDLPSTMPAAEFPKNDESEPETKVEERIGADFDQRLLDDLIKNYGEFSAAAAALAPLDPPVAASRPSHEKDGGDFQAPAAPSKQNVPSGKKGGELLDRELKKIIKDYGEYDLYSRRSSINLKVGAIALLLLGALFSGFYFFYSSKTTGGMEAPEARSTAAPTPIETESPKESTENNNTGIADRSSMPGGAAPKH